MKLEKEVYIGNINEKQYDNEKYNISFTCVFYKSLNATDKLIFDKIVENENIKLTLEVEEPILDEAERKYLSSVIRPFKNKVEYIIKYKSYDFKDKEYICILVKDNLMISLPCFKRNLMYKGMDLNKEYTLEELGL